MKTLLLLFTLTLAFSFNAYAQPCTYIVAPVYIEYVSASETIVEFTVVPSNLSCGWSINSNTNWITHTGNTTTTPVRAQFRVAENTSVFMRGGTITIAGVTRMIVQAARPQPTPTPTPNYTKFDFDVDGKADFSIFRPNLGEWWYYRSSDGNNRAFQFGTATDVMTPGDYTGDGKTDIAFYRPSNGSWYILRSEDSSYYAFPFGLAEDIPVPADYNGDGKTDPAVFRPSTNVWYILNSTGGVTVRQYGANGDTPVPADYNGDGKTDIAVYNKQLRGWSISYGDSAIGIILNQDRGTPVPADYNGDGKADIAFFNQTTGEWSGHTTENVVSFSVNFGTVGDIPTPGDFDGDGKTDFAIYRPSTSTWWYAASASGGQHRATQFGISTDKPVPNAFVR